MGVDWDQYLDEKRQIKLKYLELLKKYYKTREINLRAEVTDWALNRFPYLKVPRRQFAGSFDHKTHGFFSKDNNFTVTQRSIENEARKRGISELDYIDELISIVISEASK